MATALYFLDSSQRCLLPVYKTYIIDVDIQFAAASHSTLVLGFGNSCKGKTAARDDNYVLHFNVLKNLEIDAVASSGVSGRKITSEAKFDRCAIFQAESERLFERCCFGFWTGLLILVFLRGLGKSR